MIQEIGLDVDNLSEDSMTTIFCVVVLVCSSKLSGSAPGTPILTLRPRSSLWQGHGPKQWRAGTRRLKDAILDDILIYVEHAGSVRAEAEYLTTVKNSGGNPEQVTGERMTAQLGPRRPSQGSTAGEASMPISSTTGAGASSIPGYSRTRPGFALPPRQHCCKP